MSAGMDMKATSKTRVQRRMEKKQAAMLVVLVVVISIVSFALGVVVGRNSISPPVVQRLTESHRIRVTDAPETSVGKEAAKAKPAEEKLSFYENLSKEEPAPIGSGINLPPDSALSVAEKTQVEPPSSQSGAGLAPGTTLAEVITKAESPEAAKARLSTPVSLGSAEVAKLETPVVQGAQAAGQMPGASKAGAWVVQVFSSRSAADAGTLRDDLSSKDYPAFIAEADLGKKGIWYRVYLGPYAEKSFAQQVQIHAGKKDKLKGFVKRR